MFLLPNYELKEIWFPTPSMKVKPEPFEITFENNGQNYSMQFQNEEISTRSESLNKI